MVKMFFSIQEKGGDSLTIGLMNSKLCFEGLLGQFIAALFIREKFEISSMFTKNGHIILW